MYTIYYDYELLAFAPVSGQDTENGFIAKRSELCKY